STEPPPKDRRNARHVNRLHDPRRSIEAAGADALLVTTPANVRFLSGFGTPEDAAVLVTQDEALLLTDSRYTAQAQEQSKLPFEIVAGAHDAVRSEERRVGQEGTPRPRRSEGAAS